MHFPIATFESMNLGVITYLTLRKRIIYQKNLLKNELDARTKLFV